jgi:hypothetical protein
MEFEVTMVNMRAMLEQQQKLVVILFQNSEMNPSSSGAKSNHMFEITHPKRYCRGPRELETFFDSLCTNFQTHNHLFPGGDTDKV